MPILKGERKRRKSASKSPRSPIKLFSAVGGGKKRKRRPTISLESPYIRGKKEGGERSAHIQWRGGKFFWFSLRRGRDA